jgi:hypothetical protein
MTGAPQIVSQGYKNGDTATNTNANNTSTLKSPTNSLFQNPRLFGHLKPYIVTSVSSGSKPMPGGVPVLYEPATLQTIQRKDTHQVPKRLKRRSRQGNKRQSGVKWRVADIKDPRFDKAGNLTFACVWEDTKLHVEYLRGQKIVDEFQAMVIGQYGEAAMTRLKEAYAKFWKQGQTQGNKKYVKIGRTFWEAESITMVSMETVSVTWPHSNLTMRDSINLESMKLLKKVFLEKFDEGVWNDQYNLYLWHRG